MKTKVALARLLLCAAPLLGMAPARKTVPKKEKKMAAPRDYANTLATLQTDMGDITLKFHYDKAPKHVENFVDLAAKGFYDGTMFHRVIPGFMIQGGDPVHEEGRRTRRGPTAPGATAPTGSRRSSTTSPTSGESSPWPARGPELGLVPVLHRREGLPLPRQPVLGLRRGRHGHGRRRQDRRRAPQRERPAQRAVRIKKILLTQAKG